MYDTYRAHGYAILQHVAKERNVVGKAIDFMLTHCKDAKWDLIARSMKVMEDGFVPSPYTQRLRGFMLKEANSYFGQDMVYYTVNHDNFRL